MRNWFDFSKKHSSNGHYTHQTLCHHCSISSFPFQPKTQMKGTISKLLSSLGLNRDVWVLAQSRAGSIQGWSNPAQKRKCCKELQNNIFFCCYFWLPISRSQIQGCPLWLNFVLEHSFFKRTPHSPHNGTQQSPCSRGDHKAQNSTKTLEQRYSEKA